MATASSAGAGSSISDLNRGPRNMSAGDWIRLKRLQGAKGYALTTMNKFTQNGDATAAIYPPNKDIGNVPEAVQQSRSQALLIPYEAAGTHRIIRTASNWTDYVASQTADYVTTGIGAVNTTSVIQTRNTICDPSTTSTIKKALNPAVNQFNRMKIVS